MNTCQKKGAGAPTPPPLKVVDNAGGSEVETPQRKLTGYTEQELQLSQWKCHSSKEITSDCIKMFKDNTLLLHFTSAPPPKKLPTSQTS
ncbi:hypothetical protein FRB94_014366 [Tulasnella sp. JGI-2019a]|nr:hypothetical protein FRB94_014366 [Tulasnella sp. JGI-2019a]